MKKLFVLRSFVGLMVLLLMAGAADTFAQKKKPVLRKRAAVAKAPVGPKLYSVDAGTIFRVRMNGTVSSKTAKVGDRFTATVTEPVYSSTGAVVVPSGSTVTGRVDSVKPAAKGGKVGEIDVSFVSLQIPNGSKRIINGSLTDLVSKDAKSDVEGTAKGDKTKHRKIIFIGGGGAGGAILGGAVGGGKGALIGAGVGALGGFIGEKLTKGEEAQVKSGTEFGVYLNQRISLPKFAEMNP